MPVVLLTGAVFAAVVCVCAAPFFCLFARFDATIAVWLCSRNSGGLAVDHEKAYELHLSAAQRGMPRAQYNTGVHLLEGKGVEQVRAAFCAAFCFCRFRYSFLNC